MRAVIQRVREASVNIGGELKSTIAHGILILLGIEEMDSQEDIEWLAAKITKLRIFDDSKGVMNLDLLQTEGEIMVISQFTLHASTKKGNRPSYIRAARPETAIPLYEAFISKIQHTLGKTIATGEFGAEMAVSLVNEGPVTILIDSKNRE